MNRADARGNGQFLGPDLYFDDLFCMAADRGVHVASSASSPTEELAKEGPVHTLRINRMMTDGVVEAPGGAHFTSCVPDYGRDEAFQARVRGGGEVAGGVGRVPGARGSTSTRPSTRQA